MIDKVCIILKALTGNLTAAGVRLPVLGKYKSMSRKPSEIYATNDWNFLAQPKVESQWFECKAHPPSRTPRGLKEFVYDNIARPICGFANSNPDVGGLLVIGIGVGGSYMALIDMGQTMSILSYSMLTSSMAQPPNTS